MNQTFKPPTKTYINSTPAAPAAPAAPAPTPLMRVYGEFNTQEMQVDDSIIHHLGLSSAFSPISSLVTVSGVVPTLFNIEDRNTPLKLVACGVWDEGSKHLALLEASPKNIKLASCNAALVSYKGYVYVANKGEAFTPPIICAPAFFFTGEQMLYRKSAAFVQKFPFPKLPEQKSASISKRLLMEMIDKME